MPQRQTVAISDYGNEWDETLADEMAQMAYSVFIQDHSVTRTQLKAPGLKVPE